MGEGDAQRPFLLLLPFPGLARPLFAAWCKAEKRKREEEMQPNGPEKPEGEGGIMCASVLCSVGDERRRPRRHMGQYIFGKKKLWREGLDGWLFYGTKLFRA